MAIAEPKSRRCARTSAAPKCTGTETATDVGVRNRNHENISERVSASGSEAKMVDRTCRWRRETEVIVDAAKAKWSGNVFENMTNSKSASSAGASAVSDGRRDDIFLLLRISRRCSLVKLFLAVYFLFSFIVSCQSVPQFGASYQEQRFAMEPQDQRAIVNSRVTLPCRVVGKSGVLQWTKDDFGLGTHRNLSGYDRYSMIGSDEEGDYSLDIASLALDDDAKYQCQVSSGPQGQPGIRSRYATLTVLVPPEPPKILQGAYLSTTEDREIELECVSVGGKPAAEITWIDGNGGVLSHGLKYAVEPLSDGRRFTARSILRMVPRRHHHNQTFICQAQNTADRAYRAAKITLEVKYAPKVEVSVVAGAVGGRIPEGAEVRIGCKADANPNELLYKWYLNDQPVIGDYTTEMVIFNITRKYHDAIVKCEVHNAVGKSEETETLDVSFGPKFKRRPVSVEAEAGAAAVLACDVDGNPPPEVTWLHHEQDRKLVVGRAPNLTLTVDTSSEGRYYCKASVPGFPDIEAEASVYLKGPPTITSHRTQFGIQGDNVRVECTAYSVPRPDHVAWTFNGREIHTGNDQDYSFLEDPLPDGVKSTLIIRESQSKHFGVYNCSVSNEYGIDMADIMLKPQKSFPLLLILFGVTSGIIVIAAFVMLVILCQRKRRKREASSAVGKKPDVMADLGNAGTGDRHCKESDRSSNISDLKLELRQNDGGCELDYSSQDYSCNGSENALHHSNMHLTSNLGLGLPLAGPVTLPSTEHANALIMQYTRYSNDYTDPTFTANHYKDGHNNNGYVPYVDYSRDYNPPILHLQSPPHATHDTQTANRIQLTSLHSNNQLNQLNSQLSALNSNNGSLNGSLTRSIDTASTVQFNSGNASQNNSLQRTIVNKQQDSALNSLGLPTVGSDGNHAVYATQQHNGVLKTGSTMQNGSVVGPNGVDVRYAATYGNPYLRTASGLGGVPQVNTANPAATPAPPPYSSIRNSVVGLSNMPSGTITSPTSLSSSSASHAYSISPGVTTSVTTSIGSAQPQVARSVTLHTPQSPSSQYILPPSSQASGQMVQLTKKGNGNQTSLATHV